MIEAKELRIGNWVSHRGEPVCVDAICDYPNAKFKLIDAKSERLAAQLPFDEFDPIPLTPDILIACGFEKDGFNNYNFYANRNEYDYRAIVVDLNGGYIWFREGWKERSRAEDSLVTIWNRDYDRNYYLHQLQNAIHALCGKEINYKPK